MKFTIKIIAFSILSLLFSTIVFADETQNVSFTETINGENISVEETGLEGADDYSNLHVKVIKQTGEQAEVIYVGNLGGYDNGAWSNVDFSDIQFLALFDLDIMENELIYIIPTSTEYPAITMSSTSTNENIGASALEGFDSDLNTEISIIYNNEYYEALLMPNNALNVFITISNSGAARELVCYLAEYDSTGRLLELTADNTISVPAGETIAVNLTKTFSNSNTAAANVFLWEENNLKPITSNILLKPQQTDYYADTYTSAQNYDISKKINGKIDNASDIDYIKFIPTVSGKYAVHAVSAADVSGGLYDSQNNLIVSGASLNGGYYFGAELVGGNTYYLKTNGSTAGEYDITITKMDDDAFVEITNNSIKFTQSCNGSSQVNVNLYSSGLLVQGLTATPSNSKMTAQFDVENLQSEYTVTVEEGGVITAIYDIKAIEGSNTYNVTEKSYVSVPMIVSNVSDLSDIYFSVAFNEDEFTVFDVCEYTHTSSETGTGLISSAEVNIKAIDNNAVVFTSTKALSDSWSGNVNTVKLQAVEAGEYTVKTIAYSVK